MCRFRCGFSRPFTRASNTAKQSYKRLTRWYQQHTLSLFVLSTFMCRAVDVTVRHALVPLLVLLPSLVSTSAVAQMQALTVSQNLAELTQESHVVVEGWVTRVTLVPHTSLRNLMTAVVTVQVEDTLKGNVSSGTYTFRQAVIDKRDQESMLGYRTGEHVILFLIRPNVYGLSSPAGLEQGRFRILPGPHGEQVALNGVGNFGLFRGLSAALQQSPGLMPRTRNLLLTPNPGPVDVTQLKSIVRTIGSKSTPR